MDFEWDKGKAQSNRRKHGVDFADAASVLEDDEALTIEDDHTDEERFITIGAAATAKILVVVWTWRDENIRIISARPATPGERKQYEGDQ